MGQINSSFGLLASNHSDPASSSSIAEDLRAQRLALGKATQTLNEAGIPGPKRELTFTVDTATKQLVVKVVDTQSNQVIAPWPPEYVLRTAEELNQSQRNAR